jgi:hypothetical protein
MSETDLAPNPRELSVAIGIPTGPTLPWPTALSLSRTVHACAMRGIDVTICHCAGSAIITLARSLVAHRFLQTDKKRLFWIDSDIEWEPDDFLRLLGLSEKMDIVCGAYPLKREDRKNFVVRHPDATKVTINPYGCVKIDGTGLGFVVMKREVIEKLAATKPQVLNESSGETIADIFRIDTVDGRLRGEDIAFFDDLKALGYETWLDPTVELGHIGFKTYTGDVVKAFGLEHIYQKAPR